jgi:TatD DNase family protein
MIDVHCHLTDPGYADNLETVIAEATKAGVVMITNGTNPEDSKKATEIAEKYPNIWVCVGIHPEEISEIRDISHKIIQLQELIKNKKVIGIGEVGLDYYHGIGEKEKKKQKNLLEMQLLLAEECKLPVEIHNRSADDDIWAIINKYKITGVMHCFTRNMEFMEKCVSKGWYISFGGLITYPNNDRMIKVAQAVPADRLLLETDAPYSFPEYGIKVLNKPQNVKIVAKAIAAIRQMTIAEIDRITSENARKLFKKIV